MRHAPLGPSRNASRSPLSTARLTVAGGSRLGGAAGPVRTDRDPPGNGGVDTSRNTSNLQLRVADRQSYARVVAQPLPRTRRLKLQAQDAAKLDRIIGQSAEAEPSDSGRGDGRWGWSSPSRDSSDRAWDERCGVRHRPVFHVVNPDFGPRPWRCLTFLGSRSKPSGQLVRVEADRVTVPERERVLCEPVNRVLSELARSRPSTDPAPGALSRLRPGLPSSHSVESALSFPLQIVGLPSKAGGSATGIAREKERRRGRWSRWPPRRRNRPGA